MKTKSIWVGKRSSFEIALLEFSCLAISGATTAIMEDGVSIAES
jgi:hypothetical protein